jgi:hypothetical protein
MEGNGVVNLTLSKELITPIVERHIKDAVISALGGSEAIVKRVVDQILLKQVNAKGEVGGYSSENKFNWLDVALTLKIEAAVKAELEKEISGVADKIKDALIQKLKTQKGASAVADALLDGFQNTLKSSWRSDIKIEISKDKKENY